MLASHDPSQELQARMQVMRQKTTKGGRHGQGVGRPRHACGVAAHHVRISFAACCVQHICFQLTLCCAVLHLTDVEAAEQRVASTASAVPAEVERRVAEALGGQVGAEGPVHCIMLRVLQHDQFTSSYVME